MGSEFSISIRDFDASINQAYRTLFPDDPDKSDKLLNWRSCLNPHGPTRFAVALHGSDVVGMIALIPTRLRNAPGSCLGYQAVDTVVHPSVQGKGLFIRLGRVAQDPAALGGEILWGFPNANAARGWYGRLKWTNFGPVPLLMRPLRARFLLGRLHPALRSIDLPLVRSRRQISTVYESGGELSADFDRLWREVAQDFGIAVDRSGDWMRWRLMDKPGSAYRCVAVKQDGELKSFVATKIAEKHGARLCYFMESIGTHGATADLAKLIRAELSHAARDGAEAALAWCPPTAPNYRAYRKAGFIPVPPRLRPIEINFGARALVSASAAAAETGARWYVSFLDSDTN